MKICQNYFQTFEAESDAEAAPAEVLSDILLEAIGEDNLRTQELSHLCPARWERIGIINSSVLDHSNARRTTEKNDNGNDQILSTAPAHYGL